MSYEHPHLQTRDDVPFDSLDAVLDRREQLNGARNHEPETWLTLLTVAAGDWARAIFDGDSEAVHNTAVEVAAVSLAIVQCSLRNGWRLG